MISPDNVFPHPLYKAITSHDNDVALLILSTPAPEEVKPIDINSDQSIPKYVNTSLDVAGWGLIDGGLDTDIPYLVTVESKSNMECASMYNVPHPILGTAEITDAMLCASAPGKDSCSGDSGELNYC